MKKLVLGVGLFFSVQSAFADDWISVGVNSNGYQQHFLSARYIKSTPNLGGKIIDVWTKDLYIKPVVINRISYQQGDFNMVLHSVDCQNRTRGIERIISYYSNGTIRMQIPVYQQKRPVEPESVSEAIVNNACSLYGL